MLKHRNRIFWPLNIKNILLLYFPLSVVCGITFLVLINSYIVYTTESLIKQNLNKLKPVQAVIILGAGVYNNNRVSSVMYDRLTKGAELYKHKIVRKILVSGDHGRKNYDEVNTAKYWLMKMGVPEKDIFTDHAGFSTYDTLFRAKDIFQVDSAIVVTQKFHLPRAVYLARQKGINVQGYTADRRVYKYQTYYWFRESLARLKDFIKINVFYPDPKYLGKPIPIEGDGRASKG